MFKVGDRIVLTEESRQHCNIFDEHPGDIATVIRVSQVTNEHGYECVLEFDRHIGGHDGLIDARGKNGTVIVLSIIFIQHSGISILGKSKPNVRITIIEKEVIVCQRM